MPHVHVEARMAAEPAVVYELFRDPEAFPDFMPNVTSIEVVERGEGEAVSHWVTDLDGAPLEWSERDTYDDERCVVAFKLLDGDVEEFEGWWRFAPVEGGTLAVCDLDYSLGVPVIEDAIGPLLQEKIEQNIVQMLQAMKDRVEGPAVAARQEI